MFRNLCLFVFVVLAIVIFRYMAPERWIFMDGCLFLIPLRKS